MPNTDEGRWLEGIGQEQPDHHEDACTDGFDCPVRGHFHACGRAAMNDWGMSLDEFREAVKRWSSLPIPVSAGESVTWRCGFPTDDGPCPFGVLEEIADDTVIDLHNGMPEEMLRHMWWELHYFPSHWERRWTWSPHPATTFAIGIVVGAVLFVLWSYFLG